MLQSPRPKKAEMARCKICGFKIRGAQHEEGRHHKEAANGRARAEARQKRYSVYEAGK